MAQVKALFFDDNFYSLPLLQMTEDCLFLEIDDNYITDNLEVLLDLIKEHKDNCIVFIDMSVHSDFVNEDIRKNYEEGGISILRVVHKEFPDTPVAIFAGVHDEKWEKRMKMVCPVCVYLLKTSNTLGEEIKKHLRIKN